VIGNQGLSSRILQDVGARIGRVAGTKSGGGGKHNGATRENPKGYRGAVRGSRKDQARGDLHISRIGP